MGEIYDGPARLRQMGRQLQAGYPVLRWGVGFLSRPETWSTRLARDKRRPSYMRRTLISAALGIVCALIAFFTIDLVRNIITANQFAALQAETPSEWLLLEKMVTMPAVVPAEPRLGFTLTPLHDLLIRLTVSPRNNETGDVLCSGGGPTVLVPNGVPIKVLQPISRLAGLDNCDWAPGLYRIRLTFSMTEPESQVTKVLLVETEDVEVLEFEELKEN